MDNLCARARTAFNLLLLLIVLQAWVLLRDHPVLSERAQRGILAIAQVPALSLTLRLMTVADAIHKSPLFTDADHTPTCTTYDSLAPSSPLENVALSRVLAISNSDLDAIRPHHSAPDDPTYRRVRAAIRKVHDAVGPERSGIESVCDLARTGSGMMGVPFVKQDVRARYALWMLGAAALGPLLMILSLSKSILSVLGLRPVRTGQILDWIPLHPGNLALCVGLVWIYAPGLLCAFALIYQNGQFRFIGDEDWSTKIAQILTTCATLTVAYLVGRQIIQIRRAPMASKKRTTGS